MNPELPTSALRVQQALHALGAPLRVVQMPGTTRTAEEAARAIGCTVGQIAKSIVFRGAKTARPILVIASGANRVDETKVADRVGEPLAKATADFVREATGYAIGGVPPVGFSEPIETWIDRDLLEYDVVWAAAGTPHTVFSLEPNLLPALTGGTVIEVG
jgi:prolyl-tRNA editing enzyme YbaK/EbsC (Cys-tRNA(Pro) deacylase)